MPYLRLRLALMKCKKVNVKSPIKSAEIYPNREVVPVTGGDVTHYQAEENFLEVRSVNDRSGVYKISMVRM